MNYYLKNSQNGDWYTVSAKIRGAIFIIIRVWFLLLNLHVIKTKINANVYQVRFKSIEHRLLSVFPTPSHCVHPLMFLPKVYSSLGEPQLRTPGWKDSPDIKKAGASFLPAVAAAFQQPSSVFKPGSDSTEQDIQMHIWDPVKPVLQTMLWSEGRALPADLGLCPPSSGPCSLEGELS